MPTGEFSVLLADDDPDSRRIFEIIAEFCQLHPVIVDRAADVYQYLADHNPDVIILNLQLPDSDGYRVYQCIRERELAVTSAIIATTNFYTPDTPSEVAFRGFDGYIAKPFDGNTLIASLQAAIANRHTILQNGNTEHDR